MPGSTAWVTAIVPRRLTPSTKSHSSSSVLTKKREAVGAGVVDEDVDRRRARPRRRRPPRAPSRVGDVQLERRRRRSRRATARAPSRSTSATATRAPSAASRRAVAAPIPDAPPVTSAIRSVEPHRARRIYAAPWHPVVLLAGGTGGAKLARGHARRGRRRPRGDRQHRRRHRDLRRARLPRPGSRDVLARRPRSTSAAGACATTRSRVMDGLRELGEDVWFNLGDRDLAHRACDRARRLADGARLTEALDEAAARARRARARAADERRPACARRCAPAGAGAVPGVHDPRARRRARSRTSSCAASRRRGRAARRWTRSPTRARSSSARRTR